MSASTVPDAATAPTDAVVPGRRSWKTPVLLWILAAVALVGFVPTSPSGVSSSFGMGTDGQAIQLPDLVVPTLASNVVLAVVAVLAAAYATWLVRERRHVSVWVGVVAGVAFLAGFLVWAAEPKEDQRKNDGFPVMNFLILATIFGYLAYREIWRSAKRKVRITGPLEAENQAKSQAAKDDAGIAG